MADHARKGPEFLELAPPQAEGTETWSVTVERNGESVVTIASNMLAGRDLSAEDEHTIRTAAQHLLAFVGTEAATPAPPESKS